MPTGRLKSGRTTTEASIQSILWDILQALEECTINLTRESRCGILYAQRKTFHDDQKGYRANDKSLTDGDSSEAPPSIVVDGGASHFNEMRNLYV